MNKEQMIAALEAALAAKDQGKLEELGKEAVTNFPEDAFGYVYIAEYFLLDNPPNYSKAEACLANAIQLDTEDAELLNKFAGVKESQGNYDDARILYVKALMQDENNVNALTNLGLYELRVSGILEKAFEYLNKAAELDPENSAVQLHLSEAHYDNEDLGAALVAVNNALSEDFDEATTLMLIKVLKGLGDMPKVIKVYDKLVTECPDVPAYRFDFASCLYDSKICGETIVQTQKGIELMGDQPTGLVFYQPMLKSLFILKRFDEALEILDGFINDDADNVDLYIQRSNIYMAAEKFEEAIAEYKKIISLLNDPNLDLEQRTNMAALYIRLGKIKEAKEAYAAMTENSSSEAEGNLGLGFIAFSEGNKAEAYNLMKKSKLKGNKDAENFIYEKMLDYLGEVRVDLLAKNEGALAKNAASPFMKKISGVLWQFEAYDSKALEGQSEHLINTINKGLQSFSMTYSDKGAVFVKAIQADGIVYKILSESENSAKLELTILDGSKVMTATLTLKDGLLTFSEKEGENLSFSKVDLSAEIPLPIYKAYMRTMIPDEMEFLGEKAQAVIDTFFQLS